MIVLEKVCDGACRAVELKNPTNELLVCKISRHCFDLLLSCVETEPDPQESMNWHTIVGSFLMYVENKACFYMAEKSFFFVPFFVSFLKNFK
ncbi:hypothetical protein QYF36_000959 [Acer negundo]|nr:hypothetical protein QYF36_000959 [Acer negundo]